MRRFFSYLFDLIKSLFLTFLLAGLLLTGLLYVKRMPLTLESLSQLGQASYENLAQKKLLLESDRSGGDPSGHEGGHWSQAQATIYIDTQDPTFIQAYQEAISNWNASQVFQFVLVDQKEQADILATDMNDGEISAAGLTESQINGLTHTFEKVTVKLNHYYLSNPEFGYAYDRILHTAEHELGHAMGLDHNEGQSVMQSSGSYLGIQEDDLINLSKLYTK